MTPEAIAMATLALLAGLLLARPYWRRDSDLGIRRRRANVLAYQGRVAEIQTELESGLLDADSAQALRAEAEQQVLEAGSIAEPAATLRQGRRLWVTPVLVVVLMLAAAAGYWQAGTWRTQGLIELSQQDPAAAQQQMVEDMVARLERRLAQSPDDAEGWAMLGRSRQAQGRASEALSAYQRANGLSTAQPQADWLVAEGELRALSSEGRDLKNSRALFVQALTLDPGHPRALWYAGLAAAQAGDYSASLDAWLRLREQELPPDIAQLLDQRLPQLAELAGRTLPARAEVAVDGPRLQIEVALSPALRERMTPDMVLFVFARAAEGPPMPLAVQRLESPDLPVSVVLDDRLAMTPALKLSQFERWEITARLSRGGAAQAEAGDLEGRLSVSREQARAPLRLVMDRVVP